MEKELKCNDSNYKTSHKHHLKTHQEAIHMKVSNTHVTCAANSSHGQVELHNTRNPFI